MDFNGQKLNGKPVYPPAVMEQRRISWAKIPDGKYFRTSLVVPRESKSYAQVKTIWGMIIGSTILKFEEMGIDTSYLFKLDKPTGNPVTGDQLKTYLYEVCPVYNEQGQRVTLSKMNTEEASRFFETARNFISSRFGIVIPDPNPNLRSE